MFIGNFENMQLKQRVVTFWCFAKRLSIVYERLQEINDLSFVGSGDARTCPVVVSTMV
jgi:hypothetical protein